MLMTPHRTRPTRQRNINVLREALRRVIAHSSAFTVAPAKAIHTCVSDLRGSTRRDRRSGTP